MAAAQVTPRAVWLSRPGFAKVGYSRKLISQPFFIIYLPCVVMLQLCCSARLARFRPRQVSVEILDLKILRSVLNLPAGARPIRFAHMRFDVPEL